MIKTSYVCNSLKFRYFLGYFICLLFCGGWRKGRKKFTDAIASYFRIDSDRIFLFGAARMGLYSILATIEKKKDTEVIVAGFTCVVVTNAIKYAGLKAVYTDIDPETLNINTTQLLSLINGNTAAIVITHNFGITYEDIHLIRKSHPGILIIEDAAHTVGSTDKNGIKAGLLGDASFFSLEYSKPLTTGMGGFVIINQEELRMKLKMDLSKHSDKYGFLDTLRIFATLKIHFLTSYRWTISFKWPVFRIIGIAGLVFKTPEGELQGERPKKYPVILSDSLALIGYLQMRDIVRINKAKSLICKNYQEFLGDIPGIRTFYSDSYNFVRFPVLFHEEVPNAAIEKIKSRLRKSGITFGEWFNDVVHPAGSYRYCYEDGTCPAGESVSKRILNLPVNVHTRLSEADMKLIRRVFMQNLA